MSIQPLGSNSGQYHPLPAPNSASAGTSTNEPPSSVAVTKTAKVDQEALHAAAQKANQAILGLGSDLRFSIDKDTGIHVVKFIDDKTKEVIRQIPAQEMLDIAKRLDELKGLLIKERA